MKTIEFNLRVVARVSDEIADKVESFPDSFYLDLPLASVNLMQYGELSNAKFIEFETVSANAI